MASTRLTRTPSSAGNQKTWTWSGWVKRSGLGSRQILFAARSDSGTDRFFLEFQSDDDLEISEYTGSYDFRYITDRKFRDTNAWYHIVVEVDTTQATASDRVKLYVNGVEETSFSTETNPSQNLDTSVNSNEIHAVGARADSGSDYFDGSMAHVHLIDGTAYDADTFGQTETSSGIWKPKLSPSVTYGTNGFFLKFQDSSSLGDDSSGNTNDFTVNGTGTQTLDTPSNVFATLNPIRAAGDTRTFANGNTKVTAKTTDGNFHCSYSTLGVTQGKWYAEFKLGVGGNPTNNALISGGSVELSQDDSNNNGNVVGQTSYNGLGSFSVDTVLETGITTYTAGDIIGVAMNVDDGEITFYKNGTIVDTTQDLTTTADNGICYFIAITRNLTTQSSWEANFGNGYFGTTAVASANSDTAGIGKFEYSVPSGYYALCTRNIADYG